MTTCDDPLGKETRSPERLAYAEGMLLDAHDFTAEQVYHRGRLARGLRYLSGNGTVAGLRVQWDPPLEAGEHPDFPDGREERIMVEPGLAVDKIGRLIEVPRSACIRLNRWYTWNVENKPDALIQGWHGEPYNGVVVDVFIRFVVCETGKTPAFAAGPFDALDAVSPSRLRDYYELDLVIREEHDPIPLPVSRWPDLASIANEADRKTALQEAILDAWGDEWDNGDLARSVEHTETQDPTSVFLARLVLLATEGENGEPPVRIPDGTVDVDNHSRMFVPTAEILASWLGI